MFIIINYNYSNSYFENIMTYVWEENYDEPEIAIIAAHFKVILRLLFYLSILFWYYLLWMLWYSKKKCTPSEWISTKFWFCFINVILLLELTDECHYSGIKLYLHSQSIIFNLSIN